MKTTWVQYFKQPIPPGAGFSAYRMPGPAVHFPAWGMFILAGLALVYPYKWLWPLMLIWAAAGLYLGRDLAVSCHYNILPALPVWAATVALFVMGPKRIWAGFNALWEFAGLWIAALAAALSGITLAFLIWQVKRTLRSWESA
jgi:hypothetical protein